MTGNDSLSPSDSCSDLQCTFKEGLLSGFVHYMCILHQKEPMHYIGEIMRPEHSCLLEMSTTQSLYQVKHP